MESHYPNKFGSHTQCGSEDMMFLIVEGKDSHNISGRREITQWRHSINDHTCLH